jgi:hypothetical protein
MSSAPQVFCIRPGLKMRKIQPTRILARGGFGHNWTAISSNPDATGVKKHPRRDLAFVSMTKNNNLTIAFKQHINLKCKFDLQHTKPPSCTNQ